MDNKKQLFETWLNKLPLSVRDNLFYLGITESDTNAQGIVDISIIIDKLITKMRMFEEKNK